MKSGEMAVHSADKPVGGDADVTRVRIAPSAVTTRGVARGQRGLSRD
jgi:hypothetical protein